MTDSLRVVHPPGYERERSYVLDVLLRQFLGLEHTAEPGPVEEVEVTLAGEPERSLRLRDGLFRCPADDWLTPRSLPRPPLEAWDLAGSAFADAAVEAGLPVLFGARLERGAWLDEDERGLRVGADLLGGAFFLLTRYEELALPDRDEHGRFPAAASLAVRAGFLRRPLVNEYAELLLALLRRLWPRLERRRWTFLEQPSHDVDTAFSPLAAPAVARALAGDLLRRRDGGLAARRLGAFVRGRRGDPSADLYDTYDALMDASEARGLRSAFYFIADRPAGPIDGNYSLDEPRIRGLLRRIAARGHELGLHTSYSAYRDPEQTRKELELLVRACEEEGIGQERWGGRQHYLRFENPTTWQAWADAGLAYDSTVGFAEAPGFRCGVCYPYTVFNLSTRRALPLVERPLIVMDKTIIEDLAEEEAVSAVSELRERCRRYGGELQLLWHNARLASSRERRLFRRAFRDVGEPAAGPR